MRPSIHVSVSLVCGVALGGITGSWLAAACSVIGGVLIDLDHGFDYLKVRRRWVSVRDFFAFWNRFDRETLYLPWHGVEYIALFGGLALGGVLPAISGGVAFGLFHHLVLDQIGNGIRPLGYSLIVRFLWGFKSERIFSDWKAIRGKAQ